MTVEPAKFAAVDVSEATERTTALSAREAQILDGILTGRSKRKLAYDLGISARTVDSHRARLLKRLNVETLAEAARIGALAKSASAASPS